MRLIFTSIFLFSSFIIFAQKRHCVSQEKLSSFLNSNPNKKKERDFTENIITKNMLSSNIKNSVTIPVVVHVVYNDLTQNISDSQINEQIVVLNEDFNRTNSDASSTPSDFTSIASNMQVNFCLAKRSPENTPTNGIIRKQTSKNFFNLYEDAIFYDSLGGSSAWDSKNYLNIWVCNVEDGILGWSQFPSGGNINTDGVVIDFEYFGTSGTAIYPYNLGRTTTHEVGHWLNLYHTWGDSNCGDDLVNDTPVQAEANYGCKLHPHISCNNNGDMFMNFMDYTDDACMNLFTQGQKNRVWNSIYNYRIDLLSSSGCDPISIPNTDAGITTIIQNQSLECSNPLFPKVVLKNFGNNILNSVLIEYSVNSGNIFTYSWNGILSPQETDTITLFSLNSNGITQYLSANTRLPNGGNDINPTNDQASGLFTTINGELININISTDNYAIENSWILIDDDNQIIDSNDSLSNNELYNLSYCLEYGCYRFIINDSYGDGFCCDFGNGFYEIFSDNLTNQITFVQNFLFSDTTLFCLGANSIEEKLKKLNIYPNPTEGKIYLDHDLLNNQRILAKIFNMLGQEVLNKIIIDNKLDITILENGIYHLKISNNKKTYSFKIIKK